MSCLVACSDDEIDHQEREIEQLCLKLLLQQQPVAKDLRLISSALKMITDMERIGDHATDISEITIELSKESYIKKLDHIQQMAKETMVMLVQSVEAFVNKDMDKARAVIVHDDVVDDLGCRKEVEYAREIVKNGTGADRQLKVFHESGGDMKKVRQIR
jgi:phosphate transport system protein